MLHTIVPNLVRYGSPGGLQVVADAIIRLGVVIYAGVFLDGPDKFDVEGLF